MRDRNVVLGDRVDHHRAHVQHPAARVRERDHEHGQLAVLHGTRDERPGEARREAVVVGVLDREPAELEPEEVDGEERREERRERSERHERRDDEVVGEPASPPRRDHADPGAEQEREQERHADERDRVRQGPPHHLGHLRRIVRGRDAEVERHHVLQVARIRLPERLLRPAEQDLVGLDDPRVRLDLRRREPLQHAAERVARHQPR